MLKRVGAAAVVAAAGVMVEVMAAVVVTGVAVVMPVDTPVVVAAEVAGIMPDPGHPWVVGTMEGPTVAADIMVPDTIATTLADTFAADRCPAEIASLDQPAIARASIAQDGPA